MTDEERFELNSAKVRVAECEVEIAGLKHEIATLESAFEHNSDTIVTRDLIRAENQRLKEELALYKRPAMFYLQMQDLILGDAFLQGEWQRFVSCLKLSFDELPGFTSPE